MGYKDPHLMAGSGKVEGTEDDFPCEVHGVPEFGIMKTEGDHVLPQLLDMSSMGR